MVTYNLIDVGRGKYNGQVRVVTERDLIKEVKKHLLSRDVSIEWNRGDVGTVFAGFRAVGIVVREGGVA